jgi:hypothetical protein
MVQIARAAGRQYDQEHPQVRFAVRLVLFIYLVGASLVLGFPGPGTHDSLGDALVSIGYVVQGSAVVTVATLMSLRGKVVRAAAFKYRDNWEDSRRQDE